jgi:ABC-type transport system involved in cytochrome c biogenesis permease subunit
MKSKAPTTDDKQERNIESNHFKFAIPLSSVVGLLSVVYILSGFIPPKPPSSFNLNDFGRLPVLNGGRVKPLDTIARTSLLVLSGKQTIHMEHRRLHALYWLTDVLFRPQQAAQYPVFEIDNPDVLGAIGIQQTTQRRFSFADLEPKFDEIERQAGQAAQIKPEQRTRFQTAVMNLHDGLTLYQKLQNTLEVAGSQNTVLALHRFETQIVPALKAHLHDPEGARKMGPLLHDLERYRFLDQVAEFYPLPLYRIPGEDGPGERRWVTIGRGVIGRIQTTAYHPGVIAYAALADAWRLEDPALFNDALREYRSWLKTIVPGDLRRTQYEFLFNAYEPFYRSMVLYLGVFLLVFASWMVRPKPLQQAAYSVLILTFVVHTVGLVARMILQGRPPVTNLYSSAIFVGWVAVLLGIILERLYRKGIGSMVASLIGFTTLIIAHHLMASGDTLEMMRAVLDSNFWLATHVVCITVGYGSTFLSGFLAIVYIFRRLFDKGWTPELAKTFERMVYGIVCFATLFSFVGTILGGIWADQSWGRFWGWDPKENGALMIVLWNVFILHAKWGGYADGKDLMRLAVVGNIITSLSWFGVNMLGIGLHSYGFMEKAFVWLVIFVISQLVIIGASYLRPQPAKKVVPYKP